MQIEGFPAAPPAQPVVYGEIGGRRCRLLLRIGEIGELERLTGRGVQEINNRFALQQLSSAEIAETLRLGLMGGGDCTPAEAEAVVRAFVMPRLFDHVRLALDVFLAAMAGVDPLGGEPGEATGRNENPETSGPSTKPGAESAS